MGHQPRPATTIERHIKSAIRRAETEPSRRGVDGHGLVPARFSAALGIGTLVGVAAMLIALLPTNASLRRDLGTADAQLAAKDTELESLRDYRDKASTRLQEAVEFDDELIRMIDTAVENQDEFAALISSFYLAERINAGFSNQALVDALAERIRVILEGRALTETNDGEDG